MYICQKKKKPELKLFMLLNYYLIIKMFNT